MKQKGALFGKKILVVDDDPNFVRLLKARLEDSRYEVITAKDRQEAIDKTRQEKPDLIILDVMLPKIDGYKVASILKSDENTRDIPIVMLTAPTLAQDIKSGMESGAASYMQKPFNSDVLLGIVQGLIHSEKIEEKKEETKEKKEEVKSVPPAAALPIKLIKVRTKSRDKIDEDIEKLSQEFTKKPK
jgi:DNA-binding response OmpR family regulator